MKHVTPCWFEKYILWPLLDWLTSGVGLPDGWLEDDQQP